MPVAQFYNPTDQGIERKRRLAEALMASGKQPETTQIVSGYAVPNSPLSGLSKALTQGLGGLAEGQVDRAEQAKRDNAQQTMADALGAYSRSQAGGSTDLQSGEKINWNKAPIDQAAQMYQNILMGNPDTAPLGMQAAMGSIQAKQTAAQELESYKQKFPMELELARQKAQIAAQYNAPTSDFQNYTNSKKDPGFATYLSEQKSAAIMVANRMAAARGENAPTEQDLMEAAKIVKYDPGIAPAGFNSPVAPVPGYTDATKDIKAAQSEGTATGTGTGEAVNKYEDFKAQLPALQQASGELYKLADLATYNFAGKTRDQIRRETGYDVGSGAEAKAKYGTIVKATVLPTLKATFGGQMSITEGEWLMSTLGDTNLSPGEKKAAIDARVQGWINMANTNATRIGKEPPTDLFKNTPFYDRQGANNQIQEGATAVNPTTGERRIFRGGQWVQQ